MTPTTGTDGENAVDATPTYTSADRAAIIGNRRAVVAMKAARLVAVRQIDPFVVETAQGTMRGEAGDFLATNHPSDDPGSDVWPVSAERFHATYVPADPVSMLVRAKQRLEEAREELGRGPGARELSIAITELETAVLWVRESDRVRGRRR